MGGRGRGIRRLALVFFAVTAAAAGTAGASVRIVEDEVYFTVVAPGAKEVFLVGDFNNWNATVEKMVQSGDVFEISLYLVEGTYRYKFVVDGKWIADPDNPGDDPARGSPLVLVEKPAGLVLREENPEVPAARPAVVPTLRYIGQLRWNRPENAGFEDNHYVDLGLAVERERLRGDVVVRTYDDLWDGGGRSLDVTLDRGYVGTDVAGLGVDAFENYGVVWDSADPFSLVGRLGPYGYNAGYSRKGAVARYKLFDAIQLNALYADHTGQRRGVWPAPPEVAPKPGRRAPGPAYAWEAGAAESDVSAVEFLVDSRDFAAGIVFRSIRGLNPGMQTGAAGADSTAGVYDTRENTGASVYWLRLKKLFGVSLVAGYGRATADVHRVSVQPWRLLDTGDFVPAGDASPADEEIRFEKSDRFTAGLDTRVGADVCVAAGWDRSAFDFEGPVYDPSDAVVDRFSLWISRDAGRWWTGANVRYTRQDYGDTPAELLVDSPVRNPWLDWRDGFGVPDIVGIDTDAYTDVSMFVQWFAVAEETGSAGEEGEAPPVPAWTAAKKTTRHPFPADLEPGVRVDAGTTARGFLESAEFTRLRVRAAWTFRRRIFTLVDGRYAVYDRMGWGDRQSFVSGYVEAGCRYRWFNVNLGWGLDPVVFDTTLGKFHDYGRTELLRRAVSGGVRRGQSAEVGAELLRLERRLRDTQTIKLELMITF